MDERGPQWDADEVARRLKAAKDLAGIKNQKHLFEELRRLGDDKGLSVSTLNAMEQARRDKWEMRDLRAIAVACDLPPEWFWLPSVADAVAVGAKALGVSSEQKLDVLIQQTRDEESRDQPPAQETDEDDERPPKASGEG